jgi:hypothetical protein
MGHDEEDDEQRWNGAWDRFECVTAEVGARPRMDGETTVASLEEREEMKKKKRGEGRAR